MENNYIELSTLYKIKERRILHKKMTTKINDYEPENILDDEIDVDVLCEWEYVEDLHMRNEVYLELIEEFED